MNDMRKSVGQTPDDVHLIRQFCQCFEYLFGEDLSDGDDSDEDSPQSRRPLLKKKSLSSSLTSSTVRAMNSTFSYEGSDPTVFKAKLNFVTTKDVLGLMIDGSSDFLQSSSRLRSRLLQKPEMWDRVVKDCETLAEYESMLYQLMEFRVLYEYLNVSAPSGAKGLTPFAGIKAQFPSNEDLWKRADTQIVQMEEGGVAPKAKMPKRTKKQQMLERIRAMETRPQEHIVEPGSGQSDLDDQTDEGVKVSPTVAPVLMPRILYVEDEGNADDWTQVSKLRKSSNLTAEMIHKSPRKLGNSPRKLDTSPRRQTQGEKPIVAKMPLRSLERHLSELPPSIPWKKLGTNYACDSIVAKSFQTFIHVVPQRAKRETQECPF